LFSGANEHESWKKASVSFYPLKEQEVLSESDVQHFCDFVGQILKSLIKPLFSNQLSSLLLK
jgi:hypothetical protein